ncbi:peptidoglycan-binding protein [Yimella sp. cx-51]|uniref:C40 family peptidase n=1 Tax=Yimella sp. cx-51 TaxID=2770551 RepID=UPI00165D3AD8|nr:peptidoglycan-binding protein [Yimella sp. cx-51]MBC9957835.1 peptidoglycan-binding protein [Yimella sp. cx-51]QTH37976.1 peptidoglycan-binding protein [Yimella sp. cx-51]
MTTITPRHQKHRPGILSRIAPAVAARKSVVLGGTALAVPATALGAVSAHATPVQATPIRATPGVPGATPTTTTTPSTPVAMPTVWRGSTGAAVKVLQQKLSIEADGWFGPVTERSVRAFQSSKSLVVDGVVGPLTWASLNGTTTPPPVTPPPVTPPPVTPPPACEVTTIRFGSTGTLVQEFQRKLNAGLAVDGQFGALTLSATRAFQASKGLPVTGVVDAATWAAAGGFPCDTTPEPPPVVDPPADSTAGQRILAAARKYLGVPYVWGGSTPSGFDCSGLTQYVYREAGLTIPRTASMQQRAMTRVATPQPGDLVFFGTPAYHVGIWVSEGTMIAAPYPGQVVRQQPIYNTPSGYARVTS